MIIKQKLKIIIYTIAVVFVLRITQNVARLLAFYDIMTMLPY